MRYLTIKHCGTGQILRLTVRGVVADTAGVAEDGSVIEAVKGEDIVDVEVMPDGTPYTIEYRPEAPENQ